VSKGYVWLHLLVLVLAGPSVARAGPASRPAAENRVPNLLGPTGLLLIPSAYVQRDRQISAFVAGSSKVVAGGVVAGIGNRFELSAAGVNAEDHFANGSSGVLVNAKLGLVQETLTLPAVSVGVVDASGTLDPHLGWYVVASKYLIPYFVQGLSGQNLALKLHLGLGGGIYDDQLFVGTELFFRAPLAAMAEYTHGELNIGGRYHARRWIATVGLFDLRHVGGEVTYTAAFR
jgi:hypothetical protein